MPEEFVNYLIDPSNVENLNLLHSILESSTEYSIIAKDLNRNVIAWNEGAARYYGYTAKEILGKNSDILHDPRDIASGKVDKMYNKALKKGKWQGEVCRVRKDGSSFKAFVTLTLRKNLKGEAIGFTLISHDLTKTQLLLAELRRADQLLSAKNKALEEKICETKQLSLLKTQFLSNMSHELRTPLHAIIGFAEIMLGQKMGPILPHTKEFTEDILFSAKQLLALVNDILDLAKIEAGRIDLNPETINVADLCEEIKNTFKGIIFNKKIMLTIKISPSLKTIFSDKVKMKQIIYNYLSNACKFTPAGGKIELRIYPVGNNQFQIDVEDSGIGISQKDIKTLFTEFHQIDAGNTKEYPGTGLGLALTRRITECLGGQVSVHSEVDKGSTFTAKLPIDISNQSNNVPQVSESCMQTHQGETYE